MNLQNRNSYVYFWILLITILVGFIIIIGGLTRLTDSGLSITRWDLFSGIFPPLNQAQWEIAFSLYKEIPEYKLQNYSMSLTEFKTIYWWEYFHRLLGRLIGIIYFFPLIFFTYKKLLNKNFLLNFYLIFFLIMFQGFIGWYMVKSGLVERTDVSHFRLSLHLTLAFIIFLLLLWNFLKYTRKNIPFFSKKIPFYLPNILLFLTVVQISSGALVSGLDAGQIYNTWPLMNKNYFPDDANLNIFFSLIFLETPSVLQFLHRNLAYLIFILFLAMVFIIYKRVDFIYMKRNILFVFLALFIQMILGIFTVLYQANIFLASLHQFGSIILVTTLLILVYKNSKIN
tara:strand:- start:196 stop:1221 length:1026 start_codon:yes stop_codon:yes gene_type:complete